jgi:hypothetical protein
MAVAKRRFEVFLPGLGANVEVFLSKIFDVRV